MTLAMARGLTLPNGLTLFACCCVAATGACLVPAQVAAPAPAGAVAMRQAQRVQPAAPGAASPAKAQKPRRRGKAEQPVPPVAPPSPPVQPPAPNWPVNDQAIPANVEWNGRELSIAANNSSLRQILTDVAAATGVKVEGAAGDQRIYGSYGPGAARDVLSQLLEGSGFNVLMIGDRGEGTPRTLVLTSMGNSVPGQTIGTTAASPADEDAPDTPDEPEQAEPALHRVPGMPPQQGRTPQQMMQEIQQRQLQMQQQQPPQQGAPVLPPPVPNLPQEL